MKALKIAAVLALGLSTFAGAAMADPRGGVGGGGGRAFSGGGGPHISGGGGGRHMGGGGAVGPRMMTPRSFNPGPSMKFNKGPSGNFINRAPRHDGGTKWSGGGKRHHGHGHHRYYRGGRFIYTAPLYDSYYYGSGCEYYWNRWLRTGNPVWKARYYDCID